MIDQPFDNLRHGDRRQSRGRTITETDVVQFCMLTGNWLGLHADAEYARTTRFGERVAQGSLVFSIANALIGFDADLVEAFHGVDKLRFLRPVFIGDTLHATSEVVELVARDAETGKAVVVLEALNQRNDVVMSCLFALIVRRLPRTSTTDHSSASR